ncbi:MAG: disulfide bond formation protein B [Candidatus Paceibacterota bacterium]
MQYIQTNINFVAGLLTLISNIIFVLVVLSMFIKDFRLKIYSLVEKSINPILFLLSGVAVVGSLIYSEIVGFPPCDLCWIQRIFIFPIPIIALVAWIKGDRRVVDYILPLSIIGGIVAFYQSLIQWGFNTSVLNCTAEGAECAKVYVLEMGYVTIPFMALSVFVYIATVCILYYKSSKMSK